MQECDLKVEGCKPIYQEGVCCPVKYQCGKLTEQKWQNQVKNIEKVEKFRALEV